MKLYAHIIFYVKRLILSRVFPECVLTAIIFIVSPKRMSKTLMAKTHSHRL